MTTKLNMRYECYICGEKRFGYDLKELHIELYSASNQHRRIVRCLVHRVCNDRYCKEIAASLTVLSKILDIDKKDR